MKLLQNLLFILLTAALLGGCAETHEHAAEETSAGQAEDGKTYTCPMHPQIVQDTPGSCPICGMDLVPVQQQNAAAKEASVMLSDTQIKLGNITTQPVQTGALTQETILTGRLVVDQTQVDVISSRAPGRVERLYVKETGQQITKGQPLYSLYSEELLTLEREYLLALDQVQAFPGEKQFASILDAARQKLRLNGLTPGQINQLARTRQLDVRVTFMAPTSGTITEIPSVEGLYVAEGTPLYRVSRLNTIWVEAELYTPEAVRVQVGTPVAVTVPGLEKTFQTKISFINPEFRQNSQVVVARAQIPNEGGKLVPGTLATVALPEPQEQVITLPQEAVIRNSQGAHVWVKTGNNTFAPRKVTLGEASASEVAIASGLQRGDTVVVTGAYLLYSEHVLKNGGEPVAEHQH